MLVTEGRTCLLAPPCRAWSVAAIRLCSTGGLRAPSWHGLSAGPHSSAWPGPQAGLCPAQAAGPEQARGLPGDGVLSPRDVQGMERLGQGLARLASVSQPAASPGAAGGSHASPASPCSCLGPRGVCRALFADGVRLACVAPAELALAVQMPHAEAAASLPRHEFTIPPSLSVRLKSAASNAWASVGCVSGLESHPTRLFVEGAGSWALCVTSRKAPGVCGWDCSSPPLWGQRRERPHRPRGCAGWTVTRAATRCHQQVPFCGCPAPAELEEQAGLMHCCKEMNYPPSQSCLTGDKRGPGRSNVLGAGGLLSCLRWPRPWGLVPRSVPAL